jgi:ethanolamine ammonia-lyase small subunit
MSEALQHQSDQDPWYGLRKFTHARIALGRTGVSVPVKESLEFKMAHALARDAVFARIEDGGLRIEVEKIHPCLVLQSKAIDRHQYLQRPDLGRRLNEESLEEIKTMPGVYDVCISIADGLSATAVNHHVVPILNLLQ